MTNKAECTVCKNYYLYFSRKDEKYVITNNSLEALNNEHYIPLKGESVSELIKLLQNHESNLEKNKANLSADDNPKLRGFEFLQNNNVED